MRPLAEGLTVCEHSRVLTVEEHALSTEHGSVSAEHIVFACHYPFINMPGYYFTRQHQERSYVLALKGTENLQNYYLGIDGEGLSFRSWGTHCYWAAAATAREKNREGGKYALLEQAARRYWPDCRVAARWSAQDCMPMDGVPYLGVFADSRPSWLVATGFQKWGMSSSVIAAELLRDLALGRTPPQDLSVFSPHRFHLSASAKQLAEDTLQAVRG